MRRIMLLALLVIPACAGHATADPAYTLKEWSVRGPDQLVEGANTIAIHNDGEYTHTLVVTDEHGNVLAATGLVAPGTDAALDVDLPPGTYSFTCRIVAADDEGSLVDHYQSGMFLTVGISR
jgi:hypothetical protein